MRLMFYNMQSLLIGGDEVVNIGHQLNHKYDRNNYYEIGLDGLETLLQLKISVR